MTIDIDWQESKRQVPVCEYCLRELMKVDTHPMTGANKWACPKCGESIWRY